MSIFGKLFGKEKVDTNTPTTAAPIMNSSMIDNYIAEATKVADNVTTISLEKKLNVAQKEVHKVCLTKPVLNGLKTQVGLVLDYSGSMSQLYNDGTVQKVIEKILPMAMEFDDNQTMEVWLFHDDYYRLPDAKLNNLKDYVKRETKRYSMGGTRYSPVMKNVIKTYKDIKLPSYVLFLTDGDCFDIDESEETIKNASKYPVFWQFVGLGNASFDFLQSLDDIRGRYVDNADFFSVDNVDKITYFNLLNEFPSWLTNKKVKDMINK